MIEVTKLIKDKVWLEIGDVLVLKEHNKCSRLGYETLSEVRLSNINWVGDNIVVHRNVSPESLKGWFVKEFSERKNNTGDQPVPDWVEVEINTHLSNGFIRLKECTPSWGLGGSNPILEWKPDMTSLMEHYKVREEFKVSGDLVEAANTVLEITPVSLIYTEEMFDAGILPEKGMLIHTQIFDNPVLVDRLSVWKSGVLIIHWIEDTEFAPMRGDLKVWDLVFPEDKKTLRETVIAAMVDKHDNMNTDYLSTEQVMEKYYDVMLEVSEGYVG